MSKLQDIKMKTGSDFTIVLRSEFEKRISKYAGNTVIEVSNELMEHVISQLEQAQQENQKLIECLEWYADNVNYEQKPYITTHGTRLYKSNMDEDRNGQRARQTLSEVK